MIILSYWSRPPKLQSLAILYNAVTYSFIVTCPCFIVSSLCVIATTFIRGAQNELNFSMTVSYLFLSSSAFHVNESFPLFPIVRSNSIILTRSGVSAVLVAMRNCSNVSLYRFYCSGRFPPSVNSSILPCLFFRLFLRVRFLLQRFL